MSTRYYQAYSRATHTVGKTRQVVMLYDGTIRFLAQAREAMEKNEIERRFTALTRASDILIGLQSCLDFDAGRDAAQALYDFYAAMDARIAQLHRNNDTAACDGIITELRKMRDVWGTIDRGPETAQPARPLDQPAPVSA